MVDDKESRRGPGPVAEAEEQALVAVDHDTATPAVTVGETVAPAADVDEDYDQDPLIWNLNRMARQNVMTPEWIEEMKRDRQEYIASFHKACEEEDDLEVADEATMAEFDQLCKNMFANVDLSGLNTAGGKDGGMDAVGVFLGKSLPSHSEDHDAAESSSS